MANTTRIKVSSAATPYIRVVAVDNDSDYITHDIATNENLSTGLGSSVDVELTGDDATTYRDNCSAVFTSRTAVQLADGASVAFIFIKNSGYTSAAKTTATNNLLRVIMGGHNDTTNAASKFFTLHPNESILFHGPFGDGNDNSNEWYVASSSFAGDGDADVYGEIITCLTQDS
tara:strand:+ start:2945 stop:3466 length:522 start_codon:yes stop_codon:yes gene_type:complete